MTLKVIFAVYGGGDMSVYIEQARSFINSHITSEFVTETIALGDTPPYHHWDSCYFLCPWNIPPSDKDKLSKNCIAYFLLWKLKVGDEACYGGGMWGPSIHDKSVCSAAYNVWWWDNVSGWHPSLKHGDVIIIHETHHAIMGMLHDILGYGISKSKEEHVYGKTVPHLDFMHDFGYEDGDDYKFTGWAYEQITEEMLKKLSELLIPTEPEPGMWKEVSATWSEKYLVIHCVAENLSDKRYYADAYAEDTKLTRADLYGTASERVCWVHIEKEKLKEVSRIELHLVGYNDNRVYSTTKSIPPLSLVKNVTFRSVPKGAEITITKV